jgi:hypothetical protein
MRGAVNADATERSAVMGAKREHDFEKIIDVYINSANPADFDSVTLTSALEACEYSQVTDSHVQCIGHDCFSLL